MEDADVVGRRAYAAYESAAAVTAFEEAAQRYAALGETKAVDVEKVSSIAASLGYGET